MHRAPVVGILVLDGHNVPLPEPLEVAHDLSKSPDMQGSHQLLVVSEEQFKVPHGWVPWMSLNISNDSWDQGSHLELERVFWGHRKEEG